MKVIKTLRDKVNTKVLGASTAGVVTVAASSIPAFAAEGGSSGTSAVTTVIQEAGSTLITQFTELATAVIPVIISIAVVGLGIYAVVYLFNMAKKFFSKAAG